MREAGERRGRLLGDVNDSLREIREVWIVDVPCNLLCTFKTSLNDISSFTSVFLGSSTFSTFLEASAFFLGAAILMLLKSSFSLLLILLSSSLGQLFCILPKKASTSPFNSLPLGPVVGIREMSSLAIPWVRRRCATDGEDVCGVFGAACLCDVSGVDFADDST